MLKDHKSICLPVLPTMGQAFQLYISFSCSLPTFHVKMLKYTQIVRGLAEEGGNWRSYSAAFRTVRSWWE